ncbi:MAG TPA: histidine phosphatase family protein [Xanthomonadaceae bacterium]|nr:histidine phosphatase family protein [Xanthomonadaceae bacterium]
MGVILLVRHGQASFGATEYDALSETGLAQAQVLGRSLAQRLARPELVLCGGMRRHAQTAEAALAQMGHAQGWDLDRGWDEYDHLAVLAAYKPQWADPERMSADLMAAQDPHRAFELEFGRAIARWVGGLHNHDYPESWPGFRARVGQALARLHDRLERSRTALVFTSGGPIAAVVQRMLQLPDEGALRLNRTLANAAITKLIATPRDLYLSSLNDHAHFEGEHARLITYR